MIFKKQLYLFLGGYVIISFWLRWVFVAALGLSLVAASQGITLSLQRAGFSLPGRLLLRSIGSRALRLQ